MASPRFFRFFGFFALLSLLIGSSVLADDGRINRAPYHFGGDTLYCNEEDGCTLLNLHGLALANWPQADIATAFAAADQTGVNTRVGVEQGTYGPMELWAVSPDATTGNNTLCMIGFDEWGKKNDMCFLVTPDYTYEQAPLPVAGPEVTPVADCSMWEISDWVALIADSSVYGEINSIDTAAGTVTFGKSDVVASCDAIENGPN